MSGRPLLSVVIPFYQRTQYLDAAIQSVAQQRSPLLRRTEILLIDDGSTSHYTPPKLRGVPLQYIRTRHCGVSRARNTGIAHARGKWIAFLDADDRWLPNKLAAITPFLNTKCDVLFSDVYLIDANGQRRKRTQRQNWEWAYRSSAFHQNLLLDNFIILSTVVARREVLRAVGGFREDLRIGEDHCLWVMLSAKYAFRYIDVPLVEYRVTQTSFSKNPQVYLESNLRKLHHLRPYYALSNNARFRRAKARILLQAAIAFLKIGKRERAIQLCGKSIACAPMQLMAYLMLMVAMFPLPLNTLLRWRRGDQ